MTTTPEKTLTIFAKVVLWFGIVASAIGYIVFVIAVVEDSNIDYLIIPIILGMIVGLLPAFVLLSLTKIISAHIMTKVEILNSLKKINEKMK